MNISGLGPHNKLGEEEEKEKGLREQLSSKTIAAMKEATAIPEIPEAQPGRTIARTCQISGVVLGLLSSVLATMVYSTRTIIAWMPSSAAFPLGKNCSLELVPHCIWEERVFSAPHLAATLVIGIVAALALLKAQALSRTTPLSMLKDRARQAVAEHQRKVVAFMNEYMTQQNSQNELRKDFEDAKNRIQTFVDDAMNSIATAQNKQGVDIILSNLSEFNHKAVQYHCYRQSLVAQ